MPTHETGDRDALSEVVTEGGISRKHWWGSQTVVQGTINSLIVIYKLRDQVLPVWLPEAGLRLPRLGKVMNQSHRVALHGDGSTIIVHARPHILHPRMNDIWHADVL